MSSNLLSGGRRTPLSNLPGSNIQVVPNSRLRDPSGQQLPSQTNLNSGPQRTQLQVAGRDSIIPILYGGPERIGGLLYFVGYATAGSYVNQLIVVQILCEGVVEEITDVQVNDTTPGWTITVNTHKGDQTTVDGILQFSFSPAWTETLEGYAYLVAAVRPNAVEGFPRFTAKVKGRKVADPRHNLLYWSTDLSNTAYWYAGGGASVAKDALGPTGKLDAWTITDNNAADWEYWGYPANVANDSQTYRCQFQVPVDRGSPSRPGIAVYMNLANGATPVQKWIYVDPQVGNVTGLSSAESECVLSEDGDWWECAVWITNNSTGNTGLSLIIYPAVMPPGPPYASSAATVGSNIFWGFSLSYGSSKVAYSPTTSAQFIPTTLIGDQWTRNPALILGDFLTNYCGKTVNDIALAQAADACDEELSTGSPTLTEERSSMTLMLMDKRPVEEWVDVLRGYMPGWVRDFGDDTRLLADVPGHPIVHDFDADNIDQDPPPRLFLRGIRDVPDIVEVGYTDQSVEPYATRYASVGSGSTKARIELPGLRSYSMALRFATTRYNHYHLETVEGEISVFDYGVRVMPGDLARITEAAWGWTAQVVRVLAVSDRGNGRWTISFRVYDANAYDETVSSNPSYDWTSLPNPGVVPTVTGLTVTRTLQKVGSFSWFSVPNITWDEIEDWPFFSGYQIEIETLSSSPTEIYHKAFVTDPPYVGPPLVLGGTYTIRVYVVSTFGTVGAAASTTFSALIAQEFGGESAAGCYIGTVAPQYPVSGALWWNSETGILYLYYDDGTSSQWVSIGGA